MRRSSAGAAAEPDSCKIFIRLIKHQTQPTNGTHIFSGLTKGLTDMKPNKQPSTGCSVVLVIYHRPTDQTTESGDMKIILSVTIFNT